jgi:virulence-associated protein VagC
MKIKAKPFVLGKSKCIIIPKAILDMIDMQLVKIIRKENEIIIKRSKKGVNSKELTKVGSSRGILIHKFDFCQDEKIVEIEVLEDRLIVRKKEKK